MLGVNYFKPNPRIIAERYLARWITRAVQPHFRINIEATNWATIYVLEATVL